MAQSLKEYGYFKLGSEIKAVRGKYLPEENWVVNSGNNDSMRVVIDGYDRENVDQVVLQYRRLPVGQWQTVDAILSMNWARCYRSIRKPGWIERWKIPVPGS